jgi:C4-dicarboxylate-specific signal transduction histidine kinase
VGLGLALSRRLAHDLGGKLELQSPADGGAAFVLTLPR